MGHGRTGEGNRQQTKPQSFLASKLMASPAGTSGPKAPAFWEATPTLPPPHAPEGNCRAGVTGLPFSAWFLGSLPNGWDGDAAALTLPCDLEPHTCLDPGERPNPPSFSVDGQNSREVGPPTFPSARKFRGLCGQPLALNFSPCPCYQPADTTRTTGLA